MPIVQIFDVREKLSLESLSDNRCGFVCGYIGFIEGLVKSFKIWINKIWKIKKTSNLLKYTYCLNFVHLAQLFDIVPIDNNGVKTESFQTLAIHLSLMLEGCGLGLTQTVNVKNHTQVIQVVMAGEMQRFPDGPFSGFTITNDSIGTISNNEALLKCEIRNKNIK